MVRPSLRAAKTRKVRVPSKTVIRKVQKRAGKPRCSKCGAILGGVAFGPPSKIRKLSKSERLPTRMHAGYLCHKCLKEAIKNELRAQ